MADKKHDYVPSNAAQFQVFLKHLTDYAGAKILSPTPEWTNIPTDRLNTLTQKYEAFVSAFNKAVEAPTHANVLTRKEAQAAATAELRGFVNQYLRFEPVTNADRAEMGIPNHDKIRTDHKEVTETVDFVIKLKNIRELVLDFWVSGHTGKAKPQGYDGAVIIWGLRDKAPEKAEELEHHILASRTPFTLHFEETERGKTVYAALAWQNERGIMGQWSDFKMAIIP